MDEAVTGSDGGGLGAVGAVGAVEVTGVEREDLLSHGGRVSDPSRRADQLDRRRGAQRVEDVLDARSALPLRSFATRCWGGVTRRGTRPVTRRGAVRLWR
jgi:hypothetical protein